MRRKETKETKVQNASRREMQAGGSFKATPHLA